MMTGKDDDAASIREDSFLAELIPQVAEHLAKQRAVAYEADASRERFLTWLAMHTEGPAAPARGAVEIEALVAEHCKDLRRYLQCSRIRLPEYLVGDVIDDALLIIADKLRRGHTIDNVRSYLFTVARNVAIDRLKASYVVEIPDPVAIAEYQDGYDMLADAEISHDLRRAIEQLPLRQKQVIELRYLRDFTVRETAEILNMAEGTVGPTTTAAKEKLRQIMTERGGGHWEEETV